jgi:hypothetical protein
MMRKVRPRKYKLNERPAEIFRKAYNSVVQYVVYKVPDSISSQFEWFSFVVRRSSTFAAPFCRRSCELLIGNVKALRPPALALAQTRSLCAD